MRARRKVESLRKSDRERFYEKTHPSDRGTFDLRPDGHGLFGLRLNEGADFAAKARSYCLYKDPVCNYNSSVLDAGLEAKACADAMKGKSVDCPHFDYPPGWTAAASFFVESLIPPIPKPPVLDHVVISPAQATIAPGGSQTYTTEGFDASNNSLGDLTATTSFSITPSGSCSVNRCTASTSGTYKVSGINQGKIGTATLNIEAITTGLTGVEKITAGGGAAFAVRTDGTVWAWGANSSGQLGNGTVTDSAVPVQVTGLTGVQNITTDGQSALALKTNGTVWDWGDNAYGQLGNGTTTASAVPVQVG